MNYEYFFIKKANFNNYKGEVGGLLEIINNSKRNKETSGKFLRVWAKNQLRFEIFEKSLKFIYKNHNGKLIFDQFSLPSSRSLV